MASRKPAADIYVMLNEANEQGLSFFFFLPPPGLRATRRGGLPAFARFVTRLRGQLAPPASEKA